MITLEDIIRMNPKVISLDIVINNNLKLLVITSQSDQTSIFKESEFMLSKEDIESLLAQFEVQFGIIQQ